MTAYISSFLLAIIGGLFGGKLKVGKNRKWICIIFTAIPLVFISAFRENIGTDYVNYLRIFNNIKGMSGYFDFYGFTEAEPLYYLLNKVIIWLKWDPQWIFIITSIFYVFIVVYVCYDASPYPLFSVFLLVGTTAYFEQFNTMRQHLGCVILLLALLYVFQRNFRKFFLLVLIAGMFHFTCLLFLPVYFLTKIRIKPKRIIIIIIASLLLQNLIVEIVYFFLKNTQYAVYIKNQVESGTGVVGIILQILIFGIMTICYKDEDKYKILYVLEAICLMLTFMLGTVPLMGRARWVFYYPTVIIGLPYAISNIKLSYMRFIVKIFLIILFSFYTYITIVVNLGYGVYPYQWIFS